MRRKLWTLFRSAPVSPDKGNNKVNVARYNPGGVVILGSH